VDKIPNLFYGAFPPFQKEAVMGIVIGFVLIMVAWFSCVVTWAVASRVRSRRLSESPFRGSKLTTEEWKESVGEALAATPRAAWLYGFGYISLMLLIFGLGYVTPSLERVVAEAAVAEESADAEPAYDYESEALTLMLECSSRRENRPDPSERLFRYFDYENNLELAYQCRRQADPRLLEMSSEQLVKGLDGGIGSLERNRWVEGSFNTAETDFLELVKNRDRPDDRNALSRRLYGDAALRHGVMTESRIRYLILLALAENGAASSDKFVDALEYTFEWRRGDVTSQCVSVRERAREMLSAIRRRAEAEAENVADEPAHASPEASTVRTPGRYRHTGGF
jgi:hypothetical protein